MQRKVVRIRSGDVIPENGKYVYSEREPDVENMRTEWIPTPGIMGILPIFATESQVAITPIVTFHYYEVTL